MPDLGAGLIGVELYFDHLVAAKRFFLEVADVSSAVAGLGKEKVVHFEAGKANGAFAGAVLDDPEGHNVLLLQANNR